MNKKLLVLFLALTMLLVLAGCGCEHVWTAADCVNPNTCSECGETEGAPLGHTWKAATCTEPKTCEVCNATEGEAKGHSWADATCEAPKTCSECALTEGEALGHVWQDATTEAPKTCTTCAATEGERIITDERFTTASAAPILGKWSGEVTLDGELMELADFPGSYVCLVNFNFGPAGDVTMSMALKDEDAFNALMVQYLENTLYTSFSSEGLNKEAADDAMKTAYGMTVSEYASYTVSTMDMGAMFEAMGMTGVYYVQDGKLYIADSWTADMSEPSSFTANGDELSIEDFIVGDEAVVLKRITEE